MPEQTIDPGKALAAYDPRQYQVVVRPEDLVPLSPLVRIDLTAVPLGECAAIGGKKVMPSPARSPTRSAARRAARSSSPAAAWRSSTRRRGSGVPLRSG